MCVLFAEYFTHASCTYRAARPLCCIFTSSLPRVSPLRELICESFAKCIISRGRILSPMRVCVCARVCDILSSFLCRARQAQPAAHQQAPSDPCEMDKQNFGQCLQGNNNDVTACQFVFEALQTCQVMTRSEDDATHL